MLTAWLSVPLPLRLVVLVLVGFVIGSFVNLAVYSLVLHPRPISPWSRVPLTVELHRRWFDRIPVFGWLLLRRESEHFGELFWIRPLLIELFCGVGLAALYWWETEKLGLLPGIIGNKALTDAITHAHFVAHVLLFTLLLIATFTDFDDRTIPDMITVPGTVAGMLLLSQWPGTMLLAINRWIFPPRIEPLFAMPLPIPNWTTGIAGLAIALAILAMWSFALLHKMCTLRKGWRKAVEFFFVSIVRYRSWVIHVPLLLLLSAYTVWVWRGGGIHWYALFTSIVGLAVGGAIVWSVRIVGRYSFGMEAMGFGDVTLMAMIGSFLGWQAAVITFFLAPLSAIVVGGIKWLTTGDNRLAFGPYLSFAALVLVVGWHQLWTMWLGVLFARGFVVAAVLLASLPLLGLLMWIMRQIRNYRERSESSRPVWDGQGDE